MKNKDVKVKAKKKQTTVNIVYNAGNSNRTLFRVNDVFIAGCFEGTYDELIASIHKDYNSSPVAEFKYIQKVNELKKGKMPIIKFTLYSSDTKEAIIKYSDIYHEYLWDSKDDASRRAVARFGTKYHSKMIKDLDSEVRLAIAKGSTEFHEALAEDEQLSIRRVIIENSPNLHHLFMDDDSENVALIALYTKDDAVLELLSNSSNTDIKAAVMLVTDKFDEKFAKDSSWKTRENCAEKTDKFHHLLKDDGDDDVRIAVKNYRK